LRRDRRKSREPQWLKIAHGLLTHGERGLSQEAFWPLAVSRTGDEAPSKNSGSDAVDSLAAAGRFLAKRPLRFGPGMGLVVGVALGTESLRASLVDANGRILEDGANVRYTSEAPPDPDQLELPPDLLLDRLADVVRELLARAVEDPALTIDGALPLLGVAVAWPTPLHALSKKPMGQALQHEAWRAGDGGVRELVATRLGMPVARSHAINDANAMALVEAFDDSRNPDRFEHERRGGTILVLRLAGGISAGTVVTPVSTGPLTRSPFLEARLLEGTNGLAGELGHFHVEQSDVDDVTADPPAGLSEIIAGQCSCGRAGCLESLAGGNAFVERMRVSSIGGNGTQNGSRMTVTSVMNETLRDADDTRRKRALEDIGGLLGRVLAGPILMLNPQSITLAGALAVEPVREGVLLEKNRWRHVHDSDVDVRLVGGEDGRYLATRGAAITVFRGQVYRRFEDMATCPAMTWNLTIPFGPAEIAKL